MGNPEGIFGNGPMGQFAAVTWEEIKSGVK